MSFGVRRGGEFEDGGCGDGDGDAVRDERFWGFEDVAWVGVDRGVEPADWITHPVTEMHAGVPKPHPCKGGG